MMKKFLAAAISAAMLICTTGLTAFADNSVIEVSTQAELENALSAGGEFKLTGNIDLSKRMDIDTNTTVILDLGGYTIEQKGITNRYDEYSYSDYDGGTNAFYNLGNLTIKNGTVIGTWQGIGNEHGTLTLDGVTLKTHALPTSDAWNALWNNGDVTLNNCTLTGASNGIWNGGTLTVNDSTISDSGDFAAIENNGELIVNGNSTLSGYNAIYNADGGEAILNSGTYNSVSHQIFTDVPIEYSPECNITSWNLYYPVYDGEFTNLTKVNFTSVPASSTAKFHFDNAEVRFANNNVINGGTFSGTVSNVLDKSKSIKGGTFTKECMDSLLANGVETAVGKGFIKNSDGTYSVTDAETCNVRIAPANGNNALLQNISYNGASIGSGTKTVNKGSNVVFKAKAVEKDGNGFIGWYYNTTGSGAPISTSIELNYESIVTEDTIIYAVFASDVQAGTLAENAEKWLAEGSYTINSVEDWNSFAYLNGNGNNFSGKTIVLSTNLDFDGQTFLPAHGTFAGTFDGCGNKMSNITCTASEKSGLFSNASRTSVIKNVTVENSSFSGNYAGGIAAQTSGTITACSVIDSWVGSGWFVGGITGHAVGAAITDVTVTNLTINDYSTKSGGVAGYVESSTIADAYVDEITSNNSQATGSVIGHACAGNINLENISAKCENLSVIATNYSSSSTVTISGDKTDIQAAAIIEDNEGGSNKLVISDGKYSLDSVVGGNNSSVTVTGGSYNVDIGEYCEEGFTSVKNDDGSYTITAAPKAVWAMDIDSGYYMDNGEKKGIMRFLFSVKATGELTQSGVKFVKADDLSAQVGSIVTGSADAFYADIDNVPEYTAGNYYARAFATIDGETVWSDAISCSPNFDVYFSGLDK